MVLHPFTQVKGERSHGHLPDALTRNLPSSASSRRFRWLVLSVAAFYLLFLFAATLSTSVHSIEDSLLSWIQADHKPTEDRCPQQPPWKEAEADVKVKYPNARALAERVSGGVQIDTSVRDDDPSPQDDPELWNARFSPFREYLRSTYPAIHAKDGPVRLEIINQHALLYTFQGYNTSLKPLLLMAHQDVVPVDEKSLDSWTYPPFSGAIVNNTVWGRGSTDAKAWLFSILSSIEALIDSGFKPQRTVLISLGYDEEAQGRYGARYLADHIANIYGEDSIAMIVDEGNPVVSATEPRGFGFPIAIPAVEEKGNVHVRVRIEGQGGHSSSPPDRTTVGLLSEFVSSLETGSNLRRPVIPDSESAHLKMLHCARLPSVIDNALKEFDAATRSSLDELLAASVPAFSLRHFLTLALQAVGTDGDRRRRHRIARAERNLLAVLPAELKLAWSTTQTPTVFNGGIKLNAIPTSAQVEIDHRVALHQTPEEVAEWYKRHLLDFAKTHNLGLFAFGEEISVNGTAASFTTAKTGEIYLDIISSTPAAPRTPLSGAEAAPWRLFSSVIRSTWSVPSDAYQVKGKELTPHSSSWTTEGQHLHQPIRVSPSQMQGNTDTRHMISSSSSSSPHHHHHHLSKHVFRFGPTSALPDPNGRSQFAGIHNIDEFFRVDGLVLATRFYADLIRAVDRSREV